MDTVDHIGGNFHGAMEPECDVRTPYVVVDCLREVNDVQPFATQ